MPVTAEMVTGLRRRQQDAMRAHGEAQGRLNSAREALALLHARMLAEYDCADATALEAKLAEERATLDRLYAEAEQQVAAAEAALR